MIHNNNEDPIKGPCQLYDMDQQLEEAKERVSNLKSGLGNLLMSDEKAGVKYDNGKTRFDLYPLEAYEGCTKVLTFGANKYTPNGWKTVPDAKNRYYAALIRHLNAQKLYTDNGGEGLALDEESGLPHLDHAQCCLVFLREVIK